MYNTPGGDRVLAGAERQLFVQSLHAMLRVLETRDHNWGVQLFDELTRNQKVSALADIAEALLLGVPAPELSAYLDATIASVFQNVRHCLTDEVMQANNSLGTTWRKLAIAACEQHQVVEELPAADNTDIEFWHVLILGLEGCVLWDNDWEEVDRLDAEPDTSRRMKDALGLPDDYYIAVPVDPDDTETELLIAELEQYQA